MPVEGALALPVLKELLDAALAEQVAARERHLVVPVPTALALHLRPPKFKLHVYQLLVENRSLARGGPRESHGALLRLLQPLLQFVLLRAHVRHALLHRVHLSLRLPKLVARLRRLRPRRLALGLEGLHEFCLGVQLALQLGHLLRLEVELPLGGGHELTEFLGRGDLLGAEGLGLGELALHLAHGDLKVHLGAESLLQLSLGLPNLCLLLSPLALLLRDYLLHGVHLLVQLLQLLVLAPHFLLGLLRALVRRFLGLLCHLDRHTPADATR